MVTSRATLVAALAAATIGCGPAWADEVKPPEVPGKEADRPGSPAVHHAPLASAKPGQDLRVEAAIEHAEQVRSAEIVYRSGAGPYRAVPFLRSPSGGYVAVIPGGDVAPPGLAYTIELELASGRRAAVFASRADPQPVSVLEERMDQRERAALKRLDGRRSVVTTMGEYVRFGTTSGYGAVPCPPGLSGCPRGQSRTPTAEDQYWRVEAGYTYRPLRTVAEFGLKLGVVRGNSLVDPSSLDPDKQKVGLNYANPWVRFRLGDAWHLEIEAPASITEVGFSVGAGSSLLIGDPYGTKLTLGFETIGIQRSTYFGSRFFSRLDLRVREGLIVAPVIEVTDVPHADTFGVRLYGDVLLALPKGFGIGVRAGYQARVSTSGGVGLGGTASYAF